MERGHEINFPLDTEEALAQDYLGAESVFHQWFGFAGSARSARRSWFGFAGSARSALRSMFGYPRSFVSGPIDFRSYEVKVDWFHSFGEIDKEHELTLTYGDAIHVLKKCRGRIFSKFFQDTFLCKVDEGIDFLEVGLWDSHRFTFDKLVGSAKVQLHNVTSDFLPFTTQLFSDNGSLVGEVELQIRVVEASTKHSIMPSLPSASLTRPSVLLDGRPDLQGTEIPPARIRAGNLYEFDLKGCNTPFKKINRYISMKYGDVVHKTEKFTDGVVLVEFLDRFICKVNEAIKVLTVDLWKRHQIFRDELVGSAKIELDCVTFGAFRHIKTQLFSKDGRYVGKVELEVCLVKPTDVNHHLETYNGKS